MWCRSICSRLTVLGSTLLAACSLAGSAAYAQQRDEAWVIAQIMSGKLNDLRALEKLSEEGIPFALGLDCAYDLDAYYHDRREESADLRAKWELWNLATSGKVPRDKDEGLRRSLFMLGVRTDLIFEACMTQRLDVKPGAREANPECPWRVPIAIPAEFLSGAR
ncbi:MAG TPA: hypothetical protein VG758_24270 [Hyphomicrobiaceae bacterium]|jgi:hypothetical protein|nr:hypothetical protein [Hyphomicrobiaceae bacterium]